MKLRAGDYERDRESGLLVPRHGRRGIERAHPQFMCGPVFFGSGATRSYSQEVIADGPVRYYRLGETSGTAAVDAMAVGNGTYSGGYTLNQAAFVNGGKSVLFNAAASPGGKVDTGLSANYTAAFSVEFFFNAAASGQDTSPHLVCKETYYASTTADLPVLIVWDPANLQVSFQLSMGNDYVKDMTLPSTTLAAATDYHVVCVYRASGLCEIYVNGVQVASTTIAFTISSTATNWSLASATENGGGVGGSSFNGRMGEVAIYNKALSSARIAAHYAARNN